MRLLVDGVSFQIASSGIAPRVWSSLLPHLIERGSIEVFILDRGGAPKIDGAKLIPFPSYRDRYTADDSFLLQKICDHFAIDVFTTTLYTSPLSTPMFLVVFDMLAERHGIDLTCRCWMEKEIAIGFARRFIAISEATWQNLHAFYPEIGRQSVEVAYPGHDTNVFCLQPDHAIRDLRDKIGLERPYILFVGSREQPISNETASLFFAACGDLGDVGFDILCIGCEPEMVEACRAMLPDQVKVYRMDASDEELALAYAGALALVFSSLYEGFSLPVIEAMACGCPVITTTNGSLREIAIDDCCLTIDGKSVTQMRDAILAVCQSDTRTKLIEKGLRRAAAFGWSPMIDAIEHQVLALADGARHGAFDEFFYKWKEIRNIQRDVDVEMIH